MTGRMVPRPRWHRAAAAAAIAVLGAALLVPVDAATALAASPTASPAASSTSGGTAGASAGTSGAAFLGGSRIALAGTAATPAPLSGFQDSVVLSGMAHPTAIAFAPDGRVFVAQKSGVILVYASLTATTPTVFADLSTQVDNYWDRG